MSINKIVIYTMEYCLAKQRNKVLIHATTRMRLEIIMLRERSQTQKARLCVIPGNVKKR